MIKAYEKIEKLALPLLPLKGIVVMPGALMSFEAGRRKSIAALDAAMETGQLIFLTAQKKFTAEDPELGDLYLTGTISRVKQILKMQGDIRRVMVEGLARADVVRTLSEEPYLRVELDKREITVEEKDRLRAEAIVRQMQETFDEYMQFIPKVSAEIMTGVLTADDPGTLADLIATMLVKVQDKQEILEEYHPYIRLERLIRITEREIEILAIERELNHKVKNQMDRNQREYFLREQLKVIQNELNDGEEAYEESDDYLSKIESARMPEEASEKLKKEVDRLAKTPYGSQEGAVIRTYLDTCLELPWSVSSKERLDVAHAEKILNADHYGMQKVKDRIIEVIAAKAFAPSLTGQIICLVGPPGVGKTSVAKSVAAALNRKYARVSLGGVRDEADIRGHRKTYVGAMPGRIITALRQAKSNNALILLDEIDKMGHDFRGDPASAMLEVLDSEQNFAFRDHYIEVPFDLRGVMFITTANTTETIPAPLLDRMEVITLGSYTREEKFQIAKNHLIPKQYKKYGMTKRRLKIDDQAVYGLIDSYTREAGVRNLEREIASLCRKAARLMLSEDKKSVSITVPLLETLLGPPKFKPDSLSARDEIGVVNGLAWTAAGGEALQIEVNVMDGTGKLELTGSLGDVMKESARAAVSYIRSRAALLHIDREFYKNKDIHIHVPEGAIPKDGPSAGITIATALVSELTQSPVHRDVAMTGEVTLRGRVLPIGGLKEKAMAAYRLGIKRVIIPEANKPDLYEVDETVKKNISFITADMMDTVLEHALLRRGEYGLKAPAQVGAEPVPAEAFPAEIAVPAPPPVN